MRPDGYSAACPYCDGFAVACAPPGERAPEKYGTRYECMPCITKFYARRNGRAFSVALEPIKK